MLQKLAARKAKYDLDMQYKTPKAWGPNERKKDKMEQKVQNVKKPPPFGILWKEKKIRKREEKESNHVPFLHAPK